MDTASRDGITVATRVRSSSWDCYGDTPTPVLSPILSTAAIPGRLAGPILHRTSEIQLPETSQIPTRAKAFSTGRARLSLHWVEIKSIAADQGRTRSKSQI